MTTFEELDQAKLKCRTWGHAWEDFTPMMKAPQFGDRISIRCVRCATERHDICSWIDGSLVQREYRYTKGYQIKERHTRSEYRLALMHTLKPKQVKRRRLG